MLEIKKANDGDKDKVRSFLLNVPSIKDVDEVILNNSICIKEDNQIVGAISYEQFHTKAVIRYFVFKKMLEEESLRRLFDELSSQAVEQGIKSLYSVVNNNVVEELFSSLGFSKLKNCQVFLDEKPFQGLSMEDAQIMSKELVYS